MCGGGSKLPIRKIFVSIIALALCVDLAGGENPIYAAVLVVLEQFFAKCKFCMREEGMEKFRQFLSVLGPKLVHFFQEWSFFQD